MINKQLFIFIVISLLANPAFSINHDSLFVDSIIENSAKADFKSDADRIMFFAKSMIGIPYCGGTLDVNENESLVVRTDSVDCTTYVETVLAMYLASKIEYGGYNDFKKALTKIRYRDGVIKGYSSRLHYFSDWVTDNEKKGILYEVTSRSNHSQRHFSINYMTKHSVLYRHLKGDSLSVNEMLRIEEKWKNYDMPYIPKEFLKTYDNNIDICNGDILALTTNIDGLDVLHLGFAIWVDGNIHLLHASSLYGRVVIDRMSLYEYLKDRKKHTGVRVIRVK
ncbi:N-acetylmuramoyl-L-alanine amidase-like domain-containing protein [uncultured Bacteroides sp.]|uniref:N-acetylmuramoyl-L-alanine amidase-like domain-containing protein n=1 Tax=uncultured Bacteroides sp. TaxID=162156 RepID=UPI002596A213|nr:N-acetylmuramoyl-L-alanine amidase-like domain-containing protein [uncultured Bacteroides sp.]